jgi:hypothetical protein
MRIEIWLTESSPGDCRRPVELRLPEHLGRIEFVVGGIAVLPNRPGAIQARSFGIERIVAASKGQPNEASSWDYP